MTTANNQAVQRPDHDSESLEAPWNELASKIQEGVESGPAEAMTEADWKEVESEIRATAKPPALP